MGKFSGVLLCTVLDDALLCEDGIVSEKNKLAIEYFKKEGGMLSFVTTRMIAEVATVASQINPNAPVGILNGACIYDLSSSKVLSEKELDVSRIEILEFIDKIFPDTGIEILTFNNIYFCKINKYIENHKSIGSLPYYFCDYHDVHGKLVKLIFMDEKENIDKLETKLKMFEKIDKFETVRTHENYYEILPRNVSKGSALLEIANILKTECKKIIAVGCHQNDISMLKAADIGYAVGNASNAIKKEADRVTVKNTENAIAKIIEELEEELI